MLPDFILGGAAKAGTTAIWQWLSAHPNVYMAKKEPHFFLAVGPDRSTLAATDVLDREDYEALFADAQAGQIRGEASVNYLFGEGVSERIAAFVPSAKLIFVLREPVSRAFSHYVMDVRDGSRSSVDDFERDFWELEVCGPPLRRDPYNPYRDPGYYARQLGPFLDTFGSENVLVILYEDFLRNPEPVLEEICLFIGVAPGALNTSVTRVNEGLLPRGSIAKVAHRLAFGQLPGKARIKHLLPAGIRSRVKESFFPFLISAGQVERPVLDPRVKSSLSPVYRDDIRALIGILGRDLSEWN